MPILKPRNIPIYSGVYFFRDKAGAILYLGKAVNLNNRVGSYFNSQPKDSRILKMLELAESVTWQETDSEIEALILESQLIKKHQPKFNIMLRDDKQYFYVGFNPSASSGQVHSTYSGQASSLRAGPGQVLEQFPKISITHRPFGGLRASPTDFIGPFTDGGALKTTLQLLRRVFPYCTCKQKHNNYCLNYHIGKCLGFCCLKQQNPNSKIQMSNYKKQEIIYLKNIKSIRDILLGKKTSVIKRFEKEMAGTAKNQNFEKAAELRDKVEKLKKVFENARILNSKYGILNPKQSPNYNSQISKKLAEILKVKKPILRIEGYDVANIQGEFAVGAMIVFTDNQPDKNEYKKFKIKTVSGANDTAMLNEILTRRLNHPEWPLPDLIIVDGGRGQLNAVRSVIFNFQFSIFKKNLNRKLNIPIIALVKNEKHVGEKIVFKEKDKYGEIKIKNLPPDVRNLILQVDSEAHRFAINYYRKLHQKKLNK